MRINKHKKILSGFTLLELLLVILIMGIISTATFSLYRQYSLDAKINTTAQKMQMILQAGSSYYIDRGSWPAANDQTFKSKYLTFSQTNPWGNNFSWGLDPVGQKKFQVFSGTLPNVTNLVNNPLPQRVINLLPAAIIDPNNANQVLAEITIPKKIITASSNYEIATIQTVQPQSDGATPAFSSFNCPVGWAGTGVALPSYYAFDRYSSCMFGNKTFNNLAAPVTCTQSGNTVSCSAAVTLNGRYLLWYTVPFSCLWTKEDSFGSIGLTFIGWCYKTS